MHFHRFDLERLTRELREQYESSPRGDKVTTLHLFGIAHAEELSKLDPTELEVVASGAGSSSFANELRKMIRLSRFVELRRDAIDRQSISSVFRGLAKPFPADFAFDREEANAR